MKYCNFCECEEYCEVIDTCELDARLEVLTQAIKENKEELLNKFDPQNQQEIDALNKWKEINKERNYPMKEE